MSTTKQDAIDDPAVCLQPTRFVDSDAPEIVAYAQRVVGDAANDLEKARRLYLAVRDDLRYDPFLVGADPEGYTASRTLARRSGFCVTKAAVLAAVARAVGIPARLGFADVRNHLTSPRLKQIMGTDVFAYHGFTELHLGGRWVKATPAFNLSLCQRAKILPLEFDGESDSIYHPFDTEGRRHMEYLRYRGLYLDIPFEDMMRCFAELYPMATAKNGGDAPGLRLRERSDGRLSSRRTPPSRSGARRPRCRKSASSSPGWIRCPRSPQLPSSNGPIRREAPLHPPLVERAAQKPTPSSWTSNLVGGK